ncbi:hypothetical protein FA95DRAFT_1559987 [Auriscalpium vulgare]|uniref:Uncharacterized protein n=1 Tax=Auriscalpium vulgare TaxID=40419 RepID=A0ACB8RR10_9AGAM|nr:hypothetical protein FA95DRAFT_1559987 [Auriscalpium vulgare]
MDHTKSLKRRREADGLERDFEEGVDTSADAALEFTRNDEFWLKDGTIVLVCAAVGFRVHQSVLSMHSTVFRDMFEHSSPGRDEHFEECAVVRLHDSADDMHHLLKTLYFRSYGQDKSKLGLPRLTSLLRMARKYFIEELQAELIKHLTVLFPSTLEKYRSPERDEAVPGDFDPMLGVAISEEFDVPTILPVALYLSSRLGLPAILDGGPPHASVPRAILLFREELMGRIADDGEDGDGHSFFARFPCRKSSTCPGLKQTAMNLEWRRYRRLEIHIFKMRPATEACFGADTCKHCLATWTKGEMAYQDALWKNLPSCCQRPSMYTWDALMDPVTTV